MPALLCADDPLANEREHWSFRPLQRPAVPNVERADLVRTPVDRFIESALESKQWTLAPAAEREALLRRLSFDLTGLPPSPAEVAAFVAATEPDAWERAVEHYLATPRYGERWGKYWLDTAGYADSNGYFNADSDRPLAFQYRDYVIRAFNADKPFDQFVREQLAGDELAGYVPGGEVTEEILEQLTATHFLRNAQDGTSESDGNPDEKRADRATVLEGAVQITMNSLLGITIQCGRCHGHKFEPIEHREYYQLEAVFYPAFPAFHEDRWVKPRDRVARIATKAEMDLWRAETERLDREIAELKREFAEWVRGAIPPETLRFRDEFEGAGATVSAAWSNAAPGDDAAGGTPAVQVDSMNAPGAFVRDGALCLVESGSPGDRWLTTRERFDWTPEHEGEWIQVTFDLKADRVEPASTPAMRIGYFIAAHDFDDNGETPGGNILIDGNPEGGAAIHLDYPGGDAKGIGALGESRYQPGHNYGVRVVNIGGGKFRLEHLADGVPDEKTLDLAAADLPDGGFGFEYCCGRSFIVDNVQVLAVQGSGPGRGELQRKFAEAYEARRQSLASSLKARQSKRREQPGGLAMVTDLLAEAPDVFLLERGSYSDPGEKVEPAGLAVLTPPGEAFDAAPPFPGAPTTGRRLAFARWLTRPGSPAASLVARVMVNRVWQHHFGTGLVTTPDNFGMSGAEPSHPELLEYLADEFVRGGWSIKNLHRLILNSAVYRQSTELRPEPFAEDHDNRLLWRFPVQRLSAEAIRDAMLTLSDELDPRLYGHYVPTTRQEDGNVLVSESVEGAHRRGIYLQQRRTQVNTLLALFDSPVIVTNCSVRGTSTIPLQSLALLNSEFVRARAKAFADRLEREAGPDTSARIDLAFRLATGKPPSDAERTAAERFLSDQTILYVERERDAQQGVQQKASQQGDGRRAQAAETGAWSDFCQMLLASNAFLYVE